MQQNQRNKRSKKKLPKREMERIRETQKKQNKKVSVWFVRIMFFLVIMTMLMSVMLSILQN